MRYLYSPTTTTSVGLWTQRVWAPNKFAGLKNSLVTIFESIIVKAKQMALQTPSLASFRRAMMRKKSFELKIPKFPIFCRPHLQTQASQVLVSTPRLTSYLSIKLSFAKLTCCPNYVNFGTRFEQSLLIKILIRLASEEWGWDCQSCRS